MLAIGNREPAMPHYDLLILVLVLLKMAVGLFILGLAALWAFENWVLKDIDRRHRFAPWMFEKDGR